MSNNKRVIYFNENNYNNSSPEKDCLQSNIPIIGEGVDLEKHVINSFFNFSAKTMKLKKTEIKEFEKKIILKIKNHINTTTNTKKKTRFGSLFEMITSYYFDMDMLMFYLDKCDTQGVFDCLINRMHESFINESFFYLPQLW